MVVDIGNIIYIVLNDVEMSKGHENKLNLHTAV